MALITFNCQTCGLLVSVYRSPSAKRPRFCSLQCLGAAQKGQGNPAYNGGRHMLANGYFVVLMPDHPNADSRGYVYEHRLVAETKIGRALLDGEVAHHINGIKTDNDPSNIEVCASHADHLTRHHKIVRAAPYPTGQNHPMAKLDATQVSEIRERHRNGQRQNHLALEFGISRSQICNIVNRRQWT